MEYKKLKNLSGNTLNYSSKFSTRNCVDRNDYASVMYNSSSQIKFETTMIAVTHKYLKRKVSEQGADAAARKAYRWYKLIILKTELRLLSA